MGLHQFPPDSLFLDNRAHGLARLSGPLHVFRVGQAEDDFPDALLRQVGDQAWGLLACIAAAGGGCVGGGQVLLVGCLKWKWLYYY